MSAPTTFLLCYPQWTPLRVPLRANVSDHGKDSLNQDVDIEDQMHIQTVVEMSNEQV